MYLKGGNGIENSVDPDQTAWAVWSGSTLFAWICLSKNWGALWGTARDGPICFVSVPIFSPNRLGIDCPVPLRQSCQKLRWGIDARIWGQGLSLAFISSLVKVPQIQAPCTWPLCKRLTGTLNRNQSVSQSFSQSVSQSVSPVQSCQSQHSHPSIPLSSLVCVGVGGSSFNFVWCVGGEDWLLGQNIKVGLHYQS